MKQIVATSQAPQASGPIPKLSPGTTSRFLSGQIPLDPATGQIVEGGIAVQTERVLEKPQSRFWRPAAFARPGPQDHPST